MQNNIIVSLICILFVAPVACTDFVRVDAPREVLSASNAFSDDAVAVSAVRGIYSTMIRDINFSSGAWFSVTYLGGLSADELLWDTYDAEHGAFEKNELTPNYSYLQILWGSCYKTIYHANTVLEGLAASNALTPAIHNQLEGEAKFLRAFTYLYLVNLFGKVPLILDTDYQRNAMVARQATDIVYNQIIVDLLSALELLGENYPTGEKTRVNRWSAQALLARVYLYQENWQQAEIHASAVMENGIYHLEPDVNKVFLANSQEAIFQLMPNVPSFNTYEALAFLFTNVLRPDVVMAFEEDDARLAWVGTMESEEGVIVYYPNKYRIYYGEPGDPVLEYSMVLRLAEQYFIRAEARLKQHNVAGAMADIDSIRSRAGLPLLSDQNPPPDENMIMNSIEQERRLEFFAEWGHRWLDLKRWGRANAVLGALKGTDWQPTDVLYPVPRYEMENDPNLAPQNDGY